MDIFHDYIQNLDDGVAFMLVSGPILAVVICGMLLMSKSKVTGGIAKTSSKTHKCTTTTSDRNNRKFSTTSGKHRKLIGANKKQQDSKNNKAVATLAIENWLQTDMYHYDRRLSSCFQDNMTSYRSMQRPNNIVIVPTGSSTFSRNEDFSLTYMEKASEPNKEKFRQKRHHKRSHFDYKPLKTRNSYPMYNEEIKENIKPVGVEERPSSNTELNFKLQCHKSAALKVSQSNSERRKTFSHANRNLYVKSSSSSASSASTTSTDYSISASSSSSNSPAQSVNSSPTASPKRKTEYVAPVLRQFIKLNMNEHEMFQQMRRYVIDPSLLGMYGYPVESINYSGCVEIYKCQPKHLAEEAVSADNQRHHRNVYGRKNMDLNDESYCCKSSADSGQSSGESSSRFTDSDSDISEEDTVSHTIMSFYTPDGVYQIFEQYANSKIKQCVRCSKLFKVNNQGEYLSTDSCTYHWGKLHNVYNGKVYANMYTCCQGLELSEGCSKHPLHVWNGVVQGLNGPYTGFVHTQQKGTYHRNHPKIFAMDCEMSYTGLGMELTKVSVIGFDGSLVYDHFVWTQAKVVDYNTRFSGVSEEDFASGSNNSIKTLAEVQNDLLHLFDADTILIGHGLDSDLRVLRLVHKTIVDTSVVFSHSTGFPYRRSLKNLTKSYLRRDIQCSHSGHNPLEDSQACLELMLWKIRKDLNYWQ